MTTLLSSLIRGAPGEQKRRCQKDQGACFFRACRSYCLPADGSSSRRWISALEGLGKGGSEKLVASVVSCKCILRRQSREE